MIFRETGFLVILGIGAVSFAADMAEAVEAALRFSN
jgi:hypothetical protein